MVLSSFQAANGASVTQTILENVSSPSERTMASIALIHAAIQLLLATRWKGAKKPKYQEERTFVLWKFRYVSYVFQPLVDDSIFDTYESVLRRGATIFLIVPSNHVFLVRDAFQNRYGKAKYYVSGLEGHMSWRIMWASLDEGWTYEKTIRWWLERYNAFLGQRHAPPALQIELPAHQAS